ncbi:MULTISPECIES: hypothetical protein [unclassified Roseateles]|uniref:hypothetical protein n=1 Tax=unclassified Roseateles TaxID=2626991 RepID=UPI0006FFA5D7|nr:MULTISPECIES: hypothetical protein [unclassified Roseateles]KQW51836.1 hypothetical protein ASC81_04295 [Pelomonas sp. Root405]KRA78069.1 hypothetical protein ASD88_04300 [Pelomonas sp. Root662]
MKGILDFSSWEGALTTLIGLAVVSLVAVSIRLLLMQTVQQRRERANRQINERLKTLIAAYKTLGGSFTGDLSVDPSHLRELRTAQLERGTPGIDSPGSERRRRLRDAVEAALSDVILLGTAEQVRLAAQVAGDMVAGRNVETGALVVSLRTFIREVLDLDAVPADVLVPRQGPLRPATGNARGRSGAGDAAGKARGARQADGGSGLGGGLTEGGTVGAGRDGQGQP